MKKICVGIIFILISIIGCNVPPPPPVPSVSFIEKENFEEKIIKKFPFNKGNHIKITNINGNIKVKGTDSMFVKMEIIKSVKAKNLSEAKKVFKNISIEFKKTTKGMVVKTKLPKKEKTKVNYNLTVPDFTDIVLKTVNGEIRVKNIKGNIDIKTTNGKIKLEKIVPYKIALNTVNGDIKVKIDEIRENYYINISTVNGDIVLYLPSKKEISIYAKTINGRIKSKIPVILNINEANIKLNTINGNIIIKKS